MKCKHCGKFIFLKNSYCPKCGGMLVEKCTDKDNVLNQRLANDIEVNINNTEQKARVTNVMTINKSAFGLSSYKVYVLLLAIITILIGGALFYCDHFVRGADDTVAGFMDAVKDNDVSTALNYMEPRFIAEINGINSINSSIFGAIGGIFGLKTSIDANAIFGMLPFYIDNGEGGLEYKIINVEYSGGGSESVPIESLKKIFAKDAVVTVLSKLGNSNTEKYDYHVHKYTNEGWRIKEE